tara:strand:+ start:97 stop:762 length:666 start_codon:yes stop_codon:yes gene_type:complete
MIKMSKFKAICFDMDGIIVNSEPYHFKATQLALMKYGVKYSNEQGKLFVGKTVKDTMTAICKENKIGNVNQIIEYRESLFFEMLEKQIQLREGILDILKLIKSKNIKACIVTSGLKNYMTKVIEKFDIGDYFQTFITLEDVNNPKPDPSPYFKAAKALKEPPHLCCAFEDSTIGIQSAFLAGMYPIAIPGPETKQDNFYLANEQYEELYKIPHKFFKKNFN